MQSKWSKVKDKALNLRRRGNSLGFINAQLGIPKATLSGWFKGLELTASQKNRLKRNSSEGLVAARAKAVLWHNAQKANRIKKAKKSAEVSLKKIIKTKEIAELALALLYLGEGAKKGDSTSMGNSDPLILRFYITMLIKVYKVSPEKITADLHLRADQDPVELKRYWSESLNLPLKNFRAIIFDKRTVGRPTYPNYKGVCLVRGGPVSIQRKLVFLSRMYCEKISRKHAGT